MLSMSLTSFADHSRSATARRAPQTDIQQRRDHVFRPQRGFTAEQIGLVRRSGTTGGMPFGTASRRVPLIG